MFSKKNNESKSQMTKHDTVIKFVQGKNIKTLSYTMVRSSLQPLRLQNSFELDKIKFKVDIHCFL